jgi:uncharacterized membrane protein YeaQ/YmgE (transglycosylase-associated protein family)
LVNVCAVNLQTHGQPLSRAKSAAAGGSAVRLCPQPRAEEAIRLTSGGGARGSAVAWPLRRFNLVSFVTFLLVGFSVGLMSRALAGSQAARGFLSSVLLGGAGGLLGGLLSLVDVEGNLLVVRPLGLLTSVAGAMLALLLAGIRSPTSRVLRQIRLDGARDRAIRRSQVRF